MTAHVLKDKQAIERYTKLCKEIAEQSSIDNAETLDQKNERIKYLKGNYKAAFEYYFPHYAESETPTFHVRLAKKVRKNPKYKGWAKWARGHAKSVCANIGIPIFLWINDDIRFLLLVGQNEDKAQILLSDLQAEFESNQRLINDFGVQKILGSWESGFFITASGFKAKCIGMGQDPRGIRVGADRPDYITADDWETKETVKNPKRQDEYAKWFLTGVIPAMDNKNRRVLICQNHFAPRMIFSKIIEENTGWDIDQVNAYDPVTYKPIWKEKYSDTFFQEIEQEIGVLNALAEYNNSPHVEGKIFTDEMINWCKLPRLKDFTALVGRWDVAFGGTAKSDYNAVRIWGLLNGKKYLIDCYVKQTKLTDTLNWIAYFQMSLPANISIQIGFEAQFWNDEIYRIIDEVETAHNIKLNLIKIERNKKNKYERILEMLPQYQNNRVYYNEQLKPHKDTQQGIEQLKGIEPGYNTHDDAPDADKEAFDYLDSFESVAKSNSKIQKRESRKF